MLYTNDDRVKKLSYKGNVGSVYFDGDQIYPTLEKYPSMSGVLNHVYNTEGSIWNPTYFFDFDPGFSISKIDWQDEAPTDFEHIWKIADISRSHDDLDIPNIITKTIYDPLDITDVSYYSDNATYNVGDVIFYPDSSPTDIAECVVAITVPESFDSNKWRTLGGYYKNIAGTFDETKTYTVGDVVVRPAYSGAYTCISDIDVPGAWDSAKWVSYYYPKIRPFLPNHQYNAGDTLWYRTTIGRGQEYTCLIPHTSGETINTAYFKARYYPELKGIWDSTQEYSLGDVVFKVATDSTPYTYIYPCPTSGNVPSNSSKYWIQKYVPMVKISNTVGFDRGFQYKVGDSYTPTNTYTQYAQMLVFPNIVQYPGDTKIFAWVQDNESYQGHGIIHLNSRYNTILANNRLKISGDNIGQDLTDISGLSHIDTSYTIQLDRCFVDCQRLADISPVSNWDTHNILTFAYCFAGCSSITDLTPLSKWDTSFVKTTTYMFSNCSSLQALNGLNSWNVVRITNISYMFNGCTSLIDVSSLGDGNFCSLTTMANCFYGCTSLQSLTGLRHWRFPLLSNMTSAFANCTSLTDLSAISHWDVSSVTTMTSAFENCTSLTNLSSISHWDISNVVYIANMFRGCTSLTTLENLYWDWGSVQTSDYESDTEGTNRGIFCRCPISTLRELYWSNLRGIPRFTRCTNLIKADFSRCTLHPDYTGISAPANLFRGTNLEECDLGTIFSGAVVYIWTETGGTFTSCTKLRLLIIRRTNSIFARNSYGIGDVDGLDNLVRNHGTVYVPQSMIEAYQNDSKWASLFNRGVSLLPLEGSPYEQPGSL